MSSALVNKLVFHMLNYPEECCTNADDFFVGVSTPPRPGDTILATCVAFRVSSGFSGFRPMYCRMPPNTFSYWQRRKLWKAYRTWLHQTSSYVTKPFGGLDDRNS